MSEEIKKEGQEFVIRGKVAIKRRLMARGEKKKGDVFRDSEKKADSFLTEKGARPPYLKREGVCPFLSRGDKLHFRGESCIQNRRGIYPYM